MRRIESKTVQHNLVSQGSFGIKVDAKMFELLSSRLYTHPIRAIVRELSTNAYDAHIAAGKRTTPVVAHLPTQIEPWFSIRDEGIGLSEEDVLKIYTQYGESTKEHTNDLVGALGLGSKSPFGYTNQFTLKTTYSGVEVVYSMHMDQGTPSFTILSKTETTNPNGVEVVVPVSPADCSAFVSASYGVFAAFPQESRPTILGDVTWDSGYKFFPITSDLTFACGPSICSSHMGVRMGNVVYPVDQAELLRGIKSLSGVSESDMVAVRWMYRNWNLHQVSELADSDRRLLIEAPIGECSFHPSREHLSYDPHTCRFMVRAAVQIRNSYDDVVTQLEIEAKRDPHTHIERFRRGVLEEHTFVAGSPDGRESMMHIASAALRKILKEESTKLFPVALKAVTRTRGDVEVRPALGPNTANIMFQADNEESRTTHDRSAWHFVVPIPQTCDVSLLIPSYGRGQQANLADHGSLADFREGNPIVADLKSVCPTFHDATTPTIVYTGSDFRPKNLSDTSTEDERQTQARKLRLRVAKYLTNTEGTWMAFNTAPNTTIITVGVDAKGKLPAISRVRRVIRYWPNAKVRGAIYVVMGMTAAEFRARVTKYTHKLIAPPMESIRVVDYETVEGQSHVPASTKSKSQTIDQCAMTFPTRIRTAFNDKTRKHEPHYEPTWDKWNSVEYGKMPHRPLVLLPTYRDTVVLYEPGAKEQPTKPTEGVISVDRRVVSSTVRQIQALINKLRADVSDVDGVNLKPWVAESAKYSVCVSTTLLPRYRRFGLTGVTTQRLIEYLHETYAKEIQQLILEKALHDAQTVIKGPKSHSVPLWFVVQSVASARAQIAAMGEPIPSVFSTVAATVLPHQQVLQKKAKVHGGCSDDLVAAEQLFGQSGKLVSPSIDAIHNAVNTLRETYPLLEDVWSAAGTSRYGTREYDHAACSALQKRTSVVANYIISTEKARSTSNE